MTCLRLRRGFAHCLGCDGLDLVDLDVLMLQLTRRHEKKGERWGAIAGYSLLALGTLLGITGTVNVLLPVIIGGWVAWGSYVVYRRFRARFPDRLFRALAAQQRAPLLGAGARSFTGRAAGIELRAPLSNRPAVLVRHDVIVHGVTVAHCTSGGDLVVSGEHSVRISGPLTLAADGAPAARKGRRLDAQLMIDGIATPLAQLAHAFGERALIEERIVTAGESIEVAADADLIEDLAAPGADAYRTAAVTVIHGRPGRPARLSRPAG